MFEAYSSRLTIIKEPIVSPAELVICHVFVYMY